MLNLVDTIRRGQSYHKLAIDDFLFTQFTCGIGEDRLPLWVHSDYLVNVVTGKKTWHTADGVWEASPGESLFFKKGAAIVDQHFEVDFCLLMFFIPDDVARATIRELAGTLGPPPVATARLHTAARVENDTALTTFFPVDAHLPFRAGKALRGAAVPEVKGIDPQHSRKWKQPHALRLFPQPLFVHARLPHHLSRNTWPLAPAQAARLLRSFGSAVQR